MVFIHHLYQKTKFAPKYYKDNKNFKKLIKIDTN